MAQIYPERLPESILRDPLRAAERRVYTALSRLPDSFTIYYSVAWLSPRANSAQDGEADFVIAHPDFGILVLEVKGGALAFDATRGQWTSTDRNGTTHDIKDPVEQARSSKHTLLRCFQELPGWSDQWLTCGHGVVFPDVDVGRQSLRPDLPGDIVIDRKDLDQISDRLRRIYEYFQGEDRRPGPLGHDRLQLVTRLLAKSFQLRTPLGADLAYDDEKIIELTERQMDILNYLANHRRAAIQGCAGSGKTMLAVEKARRLADQGLSVLLTCFNVALAKYLASTTPSVTVLHYHGLCEELSKQAGVRAIPPQDAGEYYDRFLPGLLLDAIEEIGPQYDAIIVDEGQDFKEEWWLSLSALLHDDTDGIFYVFFDDNQNLYRSAGHVPGVIDQVPYPLLDNCRNTAAIHQLVAQFHPNGDMLRCRTPRGRSPEWTAYDSEKSMLASIRRMLHRLINEEGIASSDVVILTPRAERRSALIEGITLGNFTLTRGQMVRPTQIAIRTIHSFKGLDSRVVLLAEIDQEANRELETVLYVGCSRARTYLAIFHDEGSDIKGLRTGLLSDVTT